MSQASNFLENELFDHVFRLLAFPVPAGLFLGLYTTDPLDDNSGTEVTGGAYVRQAITFGAPTNGSGSNDAVITFPVATAAWGTVTNWGILDAVSGGNLLVRGIFTTARSVAIGDQPQIAIGDITVTIA